MTQEDRNLLLKDLCARLPYEIRADGYPWITAELVYGIDRDSVNLQGTWVKIENVKPYLRPMSSMTEEEKKEFQACHCVYELHPDFQPMMCNLANELNMFDWLNAHHFDYRGLIPMGLALEAPEDMYK